MPQQNLFGVPGPYGEFTPIPRAGRADPLTSHESAARSAKSERAARHRQIVLELVQAFPARTGHELWQAASAEQRAELETHNEIYRKLNDLRHLALVTQGEPRACTVKGARMVVWLPAPAS
jgi:hypothetical protein